MDPKKKYNLFKENKNFCAVPWNGFEVYPTGQIKTCSMGQTNLGNLHHQKIGEILDSDEIKRIKQNMLDNKPDPNCVLCHHRYTEDNDFTYLRDHYNKLLVKQEVNYLDTSEFKLNTIDLHWSNICNLRCVMCNGEQSSLIAKDEGFDMQPINNETIEEITDMVIDNQYNIQELYLSGGEPFYIPHNVKLLKRLSNKNIFMRINSNMQWLKTNAFLKELVNYNNVQLTMSADAMGDKFEYIRNGSKWQLFSENVEYIRQKTNFDLRLNTIFSVINADAICDLIDYFYFEQQIKDITINLLYDPKELDPRNYPVTRKDKIVNRLSELRARIGEANTNLYNNLSNCIMQIGLPKEFGYEDAMDRFTIKHEKHWKEVFTDLI